MRLKWQDSENGATTKKAWVATNWLPLERLITLIYINEVKNDAKKKILFFIYFDIINLKKILENING